MNGPAIRVGIGGWIFEPWRNNFYPAGWPQHRELEYASRHLGAIEINGTYYSSPKPTTFAKWRDETPDDFVFSLKASRFATNRRVLAGAGESIERFINGGIAELAHKLGPIVWQFAATKRLDPADFEAFLQLLPAHVGGLPLRHVIDVRNESFKCAEYLTLARRYGVATAYADCDDYPSIGDVTGSFIYSRLMHANARLLNGFKSDVLDQLAACARAWRDGIEPTGLSRIEAVPPPVGPRDVFIFFINGAKEKAPAAAMALHKRLAQGAVD